MKRYIKSPFNFIPINNQVYIPGWADCISHDIPCEDSVSGTIEIEIEATSPLFIDSGVKSEQPHKSCHILLPDGSRKYYIPGSTLKGAIRSKLETISFGKLRLDKDLALATRDWDNKEVYMLKDSEEQKNIRCGYLCEHNDKSWHIEDCGTPVRLSHADIDRYIGEEILYKSFCKESHNKCKLTEEIKIGSEAIDPKTAQYKYLITKKYSDKLRRISYNTKQGSNNTLATDLGKGTHRGSLVFTGSSSHWTSVGKNNGKKYEFVFPEPIGKQYKVDGGYQARMESSYADSMDWHYFTHKLKEQYKQGVPVFFRLDHDEDGGKVKDFGLAYLYKLPYTQKPYDLLPIDHRKKDYDLAECIFGYTGDTQSLKGRVYIDHAFSSNAKEDNPLSLILNEPKASYYPMYIKQAGQKGYISDGGIYKTYQKGGRLAGRKFYPLREKIWLKSNDSDKLNTRLYPLKKGALFTTYISFHNLNGIELGALLSAISFHGHSDSHRYTIGMGKPYGLGQAKLTIKSFNLAYESFGKEGNYLNIFEDEMNEFFKSNKLKDNWKSHPIIQEWSTATHIDAMIPASRSAEFEYMSLELEVSGSDRPRKTNEFVEAKRHQREDAKKSKKAHHKEYLQSYSELIGKKFGL